MGVPSRSVHEDSEEFVSGSLRRVHQWMNGIRRRSTGREFLGLPVWGAGGCVTSVKIPAHGGCEAERRDLLTDVAALGDFRVPFPRSE